MGNSQSISMLTYGVDDTVLRFGQVKADHHTLILGRCYKHLFNSHFRIYIRALFY